MKNISKRAIGLTAMAMMAAAANPCGNALLSMNQNEN